MSRERSRAAGRLPRLARPGLALVAGAASVAAFAPWDAFWLLPITLAALFRLTDGAGVRRAAVIGLAYGVGEFAAGTYWVFIALSGVSGAPWPLAVVLLIGLIVLLAGFIALTLGGAAWLARAPGAMRYLVWLPALWTLIEWLRSWVFSGFPWLSIGYAQIDSPLAGLGPVLGVFGVGWATALSAGLLALGSRQPRRILPVIAGLAMLWGGSAALRAVHWTHPVGAAQTVTLVQGDVPQRAKWSEAAVRSAIRHYTELTRGHWDARLIVWPETAIPDYYRDVRQPLDQVGQRLAHHGSTLITGLLRTGSSGRAIFNSAVAVGAGHGVYTKRHLVPFGEYFPVPAFVRRWMADAGMDYADLTPGAPRQAPIRDGHLAIGISICYEDVFGALIARDVPPANVLVNISDDAWFGRSIGPAQHFQMARMRALETGRYLLRVDNSAVTGIIAPDGRVARRAPSFQATVLTGTVRPYGGVTPFAWFANDGVLILLAVVLGAALVHRYRAARR